ncbi:hypothetical protein SFRURICE_008231 [Spodoptera frugiperda]|nr:hypothetical protein SFRURICE_008231 [Spodoptera frugiperda]
MANLLRIFFYNFTPFLLSLRVGRGTHYSCDAAIQCIPTFHHLCYKSHVIGCEPIAIYWAQFQTPS